MFVLFVFVVFIVIMGSLGSNDCVFLIKVEIFLYWFILVRMINGVDLDVV